MTTFVQSSDESLLSLLSTLVKDDAVLEATKALKPAPVLEAFLARDFSAEDVNAHLVCFSLLQELPVNELDAFLRRFADKLSSGAEPQRLRLLRYLPTFTVVFIMVLISAFSALFNAAKSGPNKAFVYESLLKFALQNSVEKQLEKSFKELPAWISQWNISPEQTVSIYVLVGRCLEALGRSDDVYDMRMRLLKFADVNSVQIDSSLITSEYRVRV